VRSVRVTTERPDDDPCRRAKRIGTESESSADRSAEPTDAEST